MLDGKILCVRQDLNIILRSLQMDLSRNISIGNIFKLKDMHKEKIQRFRKVWIFEWLVRQINIGVTGKTPFILIGPFCTSHSVYLKIGF